MPFVISGGSYFVATRRWRVKETIKDRSFLFYRALSGCLLGLSVGSIWQPSALFFCFVVAGFLLLDIFESVARVWKHGYYIVPSAGAEELGFDPESGLQKNRLHVKDVHDEKLAQVLWNEEDRGEEMKMRKIFLCILFVLLCVLALMGGLRVVPTLSASICYPLLNACMTVALVGAMIHTHMHVPKHFKEGRIWWALVTVAWSVALVCTTIPFLLDVQGAAITSHIAFSVFYGLCTGATLFFQQYFYNMKLTQIDRKDTTLGIVAFFVMAGGVSVASYFFQ